MNILIGPAKKSDLSEILNLQKDCYQSEAEIYNDFTIPPLTQNANSLLIDFEKKLILKAELDNEIIASVQAFQEEDSCYIGRLIVKQEMQNQGIGKKMLNAIEAKFSNCKRFELFTGFRSEKNLFFYQKLGYREFKRETINENLTIIFLEKRKINGSE